MLFKLLRWPNLVIIALTQYLLKYAAFYPVYELVGLDFHLSALEYALLSCLTMLFAGGGYIINDIYDYAIDLTNKPNRVIVGKRISVKTAWVLYASTIVLSLLIALFLSQKIAYIVSISIGCNGLLWLYSYRLKRMAFWGNLAVAVLCTVAPLLVWVGEMVSFNQLQLDYPVLAEKLATVIAFYTLFALLSTLYREVVKDMEDVEGDKLYGCRTLPIRYGLPIAQKIALLFGGATALSIIIWLYNFQGYISFLGISYGIIVLLLPIIYSLYLLKAASEPQELGKISSMIKWIMLLGLLYLPILSLNI